MPHTEAVAVCDDPSVLGRTFYLMGFVDGWSPITEPEWPEPFFSDLDARQGLAYELIDGIARLSKVDWQAKGLQDLGRPDGFHDRQVDRWLAFLDRIKGRELPGLDEASQWLRDHRPIDFIPGLMHGDYQFANVMYHHGAPARLAAIVDWEMGTVGDPKLDLAWVVQSWPEEGTDGFDLGYVDLTGMPTRDQLLARYAETSGRQVDDIDYYVVLARWKLAIVLEQGFQHAGDDPKLDRVRRHRARAHGGCRRAGRDERLPVNGQRSVADRFDLRGKVAVVTGGSRGIGRAVALGLAGAGADVVIASRKLDRCEQTAAEVRETTGRRALPVACHVGRWPECDALVEAVYAAFGRCDVLVNNAGMSPLYPDLPSVTEDLYDKVHTVNARGPFRIASLIGARMHAGDGGSIINVSTAGSLRPDATDLPYAMAKASLNALTLGLAGAWAPKVRANLVLPGAFDTDITLAWGDDMKAAAGAANPMGRIGQPDDLVGLCLFLASDASRYVNGAQVLVDGGLYRSL